MPIIKLHIPEESCSGCSFFCEKTIDHNYYGEKSTQYQCALFNCSIRDEQKCLECRQLCAGEES